jgi:hypothetical protein
MRIILIVAQFSRARMRASGHLLISLPHGQV